MPSEIANAVPFEQDRTHAQYDREYAARFQQVLVQAARVLNEFRAWEGRPLPDGSRVIAARPSLDIAHARVWQ
jgi:hypothetical protein